MSLLVRGKGSEVTGSQERKQEGKGYFPALLIPRVRELGRRRNYDLGREGEGMRSLGLSRCELGTKLQLHLKVDQLFPLNSHLPKASGCKMSDKRFWISLLLMLMACSQSTLPGTAYMVVKSYKPLEKPLSTED